MAEFPIYGRFIGDFVPHLVAVDTDDTMDVVAQKIAQYTLGKRLPFPAGKPSYDVLINGEVIDPSRTFGAVLEEKQLPVLQWVDARYRETADA